MLQALSEPSLTRVRAAPRALSFSTGSAALENTAGRLKINEEFAPGEVIHVTNIEHVFRQSQV